MPQLDEVILLSDDGRPIGTAARSDVHHAATPLHLAFSCYLLDADGHVLLTRRALGKRAWPGVWTNSFCGHPRPREPVEDAIRRHAQHELGTTVSTPACAVPDFRYRAVDPSGVVENEICPVYVAQSTAALAPNPDEVIEHRWVSVSELAGVVASAPWALSPWTVQQVVRLAKSGFDALRPPGP